ncbi:flagellar biosynthesis protein FlhA [Candidatus Laterigemmans baculatus]|uniref:flagellar biosynthesis protein FlhA n=1 Tax=Candidatus Laterigemmans baculatus TaxID=2770505 RepID=UPI0013DCAEC4|nr:flagellar biosynthesis protein FlhA [Candidatus Laterigemmans baculatus]
MQQLTRYRDLILPLAIIGSLVVILVPLPPLLMDLMLAANITVGVIVLLTTIYVGSPMEFNIFPTLLLATTLARLVLNVATTRLILTEAGKSGAVGGVISGFGEFVAGDRIEIGLIIFVIIVVIQFVVITKGATRISEVAARFALDGMPGRQMAIDADLNAGLIDEKDAQRRREEISQQADFYGAMDGASKFVRGDAIAGIFIMIINIGGGLYIGTVRDGMPVSEAASLFTKLTIGDGLVSQVPALLISLAAGLLVTRSAKQSNLPHEFLQQLFGNPRAMAIAGLFLFLLMVTELPAVPMATLGSGCLGLAVVMTRQTRRETAAADQQAENERAAAEAPPAKRPEDFLTVDPMELSLGLGLLALADPARGGDLMERITGVRNQLAGDIGVVLPKVRVRDNMELAEHEYEVRIAGSRVARGVVLPGYLLAIDSGMTTGVIEGQPTRDPTFGQPAVWIEPARREQAAIYGYTTAEPGAVVATHLQRIATQYADELLNRDATKHLIDELKELAPAVVDELIPGQMKLAEVQQVLQMLLREDVPIRQLGIILETLGDYAPRTKDPVWLVEYVRHRLARTISTRYRDASDRLHVVALDPQLEDRIAEGVEHTERGMMVRMTPAATEQLCKQIGDAVRKLIAVGHPPVVLVNPRIRPGLRHLTATTLPDLRVLSYNEITQDTAIESVGIVGPAA